MMRNVIKGILTAIYVLIAVAIFASPTHAKYPDPPKVGEQWQIAAWCEAKDKPAIKRMRRALSAAPREERMKLYLAEIGRNDSTCVDIRMIPLPPERVRVLKVLFLLRTADNICGRMYLSETRDGTKLVFWFPVACSETNK